METTQRLEPNLAQDNGPVFRSAPHNIEAEQALLGAILVNNEACDRVSSFLEPGHFFDPLHGRDSWRRLAGGLAPYAPTRAHGGFVHVDTRGQPARWGR